jgi:hypothetical protein
MMMLPEIEAQTMQAAVVAAELSNVSVDHGKGLEKGKKGKIKKEKSGQGGGGGGVLLPSPVKAVVI